jgi:hypothetical protein
MMKNNPIIVFPKKQTVEIQYREIKQPGSGEHAVKRMISHRVSYKDAPEIYCRLFKDRSQYMGIVIDCDGVG